MKSTVGRDLFSSVIEDFWERHRLPRDTSLLVAFSGGPDSTALLQALCEFKEKSSIFLSAVYVDHGMRSQEERDLDISFTSTFAAERDLPFFIQRIPEGKVQNLVDSSGRSPEEAARILRYRELYSIQKSLGCSYIALGHTFDDQLETLIMRFFQGSGARGLRGIQEKREKLIRPLLSVEREEILQFLKVRSLSYRMDKTNYEESYLRNRVRIRIVPAVRELFPGLKTSLPLLAERMGHLWELLKKETTSLAWESTEKGYRLGLKEFTSLSPQGRAELLFSVYPQLKQKAGSYCPLPYRFIHKILLQESFINGKELLRGHGVTLYTGGGYIFWERDVVLSPKKRYLILIKPDTICSFGGLSFRIEQGYKVYQDANEIWIPKELVEFPLVMRSRKEGDSIILPEGRKKIKKLLNEWKVPVGKREEIPILEDRKGVIAVLGKPLGFKNRVAKRVKVEITGTQSLIIVSLIRNGDER